MDEALKTKLLLSSVGADMRHWRMLQDYGITLAEILYGDYDKLKDVGFREKPVDNIRENNRACWAEAEFERAASLGVDLVSCDDINYPEALFELKDPPVLLYWYGSAKSISFPSIAVVGTRKCTVYGRETARRIGEMCALTHRTVVSGGASGIDGAAHGGVCENNGETFAVFGNGVDVVFPRANSALFDKIRENGALISEFPLGSGGEAWRFPKRNRLVAALSEKLIVVEAPIKSGAMITARMSLDLGHEVWAVPGRISEEASEGSNRLIFDGAYPYISHDIFFGKETGQTSLFKDSTPLNSTENLSADERAVMKVLWRCGAQTVDNLAVEVKMSAADVMKIIAVLSAGGYVYPAGPGRFSAKV